MKIGINSLWVKPLVEIEIDPQYLLPSDTVSPFIKQFYTLSHPSIPENLNEKISLEDANRIMQDMDLSLDQNTSESIIERIKNSEVSYEEFLSILSEKGAMQSKADILRKAPNLISVKDGKYKEIFRSKKGNFNLVNYITQIFRRKNSSDAAAAEIKKFSESLKKENLKEDEVKWLMSVYNQNCLNGPGMYFVQKYFAENMIDSGCNIVFKRICFDDKKRTANCEPIYISLENGSIKSLTILDTVQPLIFDLSRLEDGEELPLPFLIKTRIEIKFETNQPKSLVGTAKIESIKMNLEVYRETDNKQTKIAANKQILDSDIFNLGNLISNIKSTMSSNTDKMNNLNEKLINSADLSSPKNIFSLISNKIANIFGLFSGKTNKADSFSKDDTESAKTGKSGEKRNFFSPNETKHIPPRQDKIQH